MLLNVLGCPGSEKKILMILAPFLITFGEFPHYYLAMRSLSVPQYGSLLCIGTSNFKIVYDHDRREALGIWKSRLGSGATYRALIEVFFKAGRLDCADAVCDLLKGSSDTRGRYLTIYFDPGDGLESNV